MTITKMKKTNVKKLDFFILERMVIELVIRYVLTKNVVTVFSLVDNFSSGSWSIKGIFVLIRESNFSQF